VRTESGGTADWGYCPADLRNFFSGRWNLVRTIEDRQRGETGTLTGLAEFKPNVDADGVGLVYREDGRLEIGTYRGKAHQCYLYRFPAEGSLEALFPDRRPFHMAVLLTGEAEAEHACPPDFYKGRYLLVGPDCWTLNWRVTGPRKDQIITSRYLRPGAASTGPANASPLALRPGHA